MTATPIWWQDESLHFLDDTLSFINSSQSRDEPVSRCDDLCKALNRTWNAFFQHRRKAGQLNDKELENEATGKRSDNQSFQELMLHGIAEQQALALCESIRCFAELCPHIMNHDTLLNERYDPRNITADVRKKATGEHRQLLNAFRRFSESPNDSTLREALLKKIAQLIYITRSNIAHSEKTPQGPDLEKSERDRLVSEVTARVVDDLFDILFDRPSHRLAVYGTLLPDRPNGSELAGLDGQWHTGQVNGTLDKRDGFLEFHWRLGASALTMKVLVASDLAMWFQRLDRFEGPRYQRSLVPVLIDGRTCVCNIYQGKRGTPRS